MKLTRAIASAAAVVAIACVAHSTTYGQLVINELVKEVRNGSTSGIVAASGREFVELYNAGSTPIDLTNWVLQTVSLSSGAPDQTFFIPSGTIAPGGYFVIGDAALGAVVNYTPASGNIFTDVVGRLMELRDANGTMIDAVAYEVYRTGTNGLTALTTEQRNQVGNGYQGEHFSVDAISPNVAASWARYQDGLDRNKNGLDFGFLLPTPGANNYPGTIQTAHQVPNVDALTVGDSLTQYHGSWFLPRVIDPTQATAINPKAIPASPQGGKAIIAWDQTGGGNVVYSKELVNSFDLYAYLNTNVPGVPVLDEEWESTIYGIGSSDPFFRNPDPTNGIRTAPLGTATELVTRNSSTGVGWLFQRYEDNSATNDPDFVKLMLVDFGQGGDSEVPGDMAWNVLHTIDLLGVAPAWHRLGLSYNPATREIIGTYDGQQFPFTLSYDLYGTFFVGYREAISGAVSLHLDKHAPPIYDMFVAPGLAGDHNKDGVVDAADYVVWRKDPASYGNAQGYTDWVRDFGKTLPGSGGTGGADAVPEPASLALLALGLLALGAQRRRG